MSPENLSKRAADVAIRERPRKQGDGGEIEKAIPHEADFLDLESARTFSFRGNNFRQTY